LKPEDCERNFKEEQLRFKKLIPTLDDHLIILLKGHLLIEEKLWQIITTCVSDVRPLESCKLSFIQKLHIAKSLSGNFLKDEIYNTIKRLNSIRNILSHQAEPDNIDDLLRAFINDSYEIHKIRRLPNEQSIENIQNIKLRGLIGYLWASLIGIWEALQVVHDHIPIPMRTKR
jgi:hypothetical protein